MIRERANDAKVAAARAALFDLFGDRSLPPPELRRQLKLLAELIRLQLKALDAEITSL
jgi:hypothetical protein